MSESLWMIPVLQFSGETLGHPWGNAPGAVTNRILEEVAIIPSKRMRNKITGFSTHLMKWIQKGPVHGISLKLQEEEREKHMHCVLDDLGFSCAIAIPTNPRARGTEIALAFLELVEVSLKTRQSSRWDKNLRIDLSTFSIVDNLDMLYDYHWDKICYQSLIRSLGHGWRKKVKVAKNKESKKMLYTLYGFSIAIQPCYKLDVIARDVVDLQDAPPQAQVDSKNDKTEDTDGDVNGKGSENRIMSEDSYQTPQQDQMHKHDQYVVHGSV
ncbi:Uncharacterized protein Fot_10536 [Forsythia ovata]|uniref:Uncharacterized protein n=1 Tax=Forsythia ovata TaxID=205694 RepID=A0ABD1WHI4_9LAMI